MNKILRFSFMALLTIIGVSSAVAQEVTIDFDADYATLFPTIKGTSSGSGSSYVSDGDFLEATTSAAVDGITVTVSPKTSGSNENRIWSSAPRLRMYSGTITFKASGKNITKMEMTINTNNSLVAKNNTVDKGTLTTTGVAASNGVIEWTGSESEVTMTIAGNTQFHKIVFTLSDATDSRSATTIEFSEGYQTRFTYGANGDDVALPTATVKAGDTSLDAAVTWELAKGTDFEVGDKEPAIEGNKINPSNHSYGKLTLTANYAGDATYKPSSKSYTLTVYKGYLSLAGIVEDFMKEDSKFTSAGIPVSYWAMVNETTAGTATVTYVNGSYTYINDGTNDLLLYGSNLGLEKGDVISNDKGNDQGFDAIYGTMKTYNGLLELATSKDEMLFTVKSKGAEVTPKTLDIANIGDVKNMNAYLKIENAEYVKPESDASNNKNYIFKVGDSEFVVRQNWSNVAVTDLEVGAKYTLEGMGAIYASGENKTYQLYLIAFEKTGNSSGINAIQAEAQQGKVYNLQGQRMEKAVKGLYIVGGKKVIVK